MKQKSWFKRHPIWVGIIIGIALYVGWIYLALADVNGNPFGVNSGKIETHLEIIEIISDGAEQRVSLYKVGGSEYFEFVMNVIEDDFETLDNSEAKLKKYGVGERRDVVRALEFARLDLEIAKSQIMTLAGVQ